VQSYRERGPRRIEPDSRLLQRPSRQDRFVGRLKELRNPSAKAFLRGKEQYTGEDEKIPCCQRNPKFTPDESSQDVPCDELFNARVITDPQSCNTFESGKECVWICDGAPVGITFDTDVVSEDVLTQNKNPYDDDYYAPRGGMYNRYGGGAPQRRGGPPRGKGRNGPRSGPDFYKNANRYRNKREKVVNMNQFFNRGRQDRKARGPGPNMSQHMHIDRAGAYYDYNYFYDYGYNDYDYDDYYLDMRENQNQLQKENAMLIDKDKKLAQANEQLHLRLGTLEEKMEELLTKIGKDDFEIEEEELQLEEEIEDENISLENKEIALENLEKVFDEEEEILEDIEEEADYLEDDEKEEEEEEYLEKAGDTVTEIIYDLFKTKKTDEEKEAVENQDNKPLPPEVLEQIERTVPKFEEKYDLEDNVDRKVGGKYFGDRKAKEGWFQDEEEVKEELEKELDDTTLPDRGF